MNIKEVSEKYANIDIGDLSGNQQDEIRNILSKTQPEDLHTLEEHKLYIEVLQKLRRANVKGMDCAGSKLLDMLKSLLAVGEDGIYSNSRRFLYELIQNVDDCEYESVEDCRLDIHFDYSSSPGKIVLTYNEKGFKPENVFAITGLAETSKNISEDKVEIGEKGIGFKSVFGIAEKVHIESGGFSFELYRDNFIVPIPRYENFKRIEGTRLTLEMPTETVKNIYRSIAEEYIKSDAVLNQNPILFLNKLTHLKMYFDGWRCIVFDVERKQPELIAGGIAFEDDVIVSVDMKDSYHGKDMAYSSIISCKRYTQPIVYGEKECKARYGEKALFSERRHHLIAVFPSLTDDLKDFNGLLYSFLPTQIQMTTPVILHVPFKLDGSREFVDSQEDNLWFSFTIERLVDFLKKSYVHLATLVKQDVIAYIPKKNEFFFKKTNEKITCLQKNDLKGATICQEKVFYTTDGSCEDVNGIVSFSKHENLEKPEEVFALLGKSGKLFVPNTPVDMKKYGARVIENAPACLFRCGLRDGAHFNEIVNLLKGIDKDLDYAKLIKESCPLVLTKAQLLVINDYKKFYTAFNHYMDQCLQAKEFPEVSFSDELPMVDETFSNEMRELIPSADLEEGFEAYLKKANYRFYVLEGIKSEFAVAGKNGIVLAEGAVRGSFGSLATKYDPRRVFVATLQLRQASDKLNDADESMSDAEYLKLLRSVRVSLKNAFGDKIYQTYIKLINQSGMDPHRFLNELLQNADDCEYPEGEEPTFELKRNKELIQVSYNELGFTKQNVRAITAIGESTKKQLLDGRDDSIGEKGVGFKSVFSVAKSVEIHSNNFDFKLTDQTPIVPDKCDPLDDKKKTGTTLVFSMKKNVDQVFEKDHILELCLCLRKLKHINILGTQVTISDSEEGRVVKINNESHHFEKFTYAFNVEDESAIAERAANKRSISKKQHIYFYIPTKPRKTWLYVGLPTKVEARIPLIMDAPFELTTSRDYVIQCRWNEIVRTAVYSAILELMFANRGKWRIDVFKFVKFVTKDNVSTYETFSDTYLNNFTWRDKLETAELLPVLNTDDEFVSAKASNCFIVPEVVALISKDMKIADKFNGVMIDTYQKSQYESLLKHIGCKQSPVEANLDCIRMATDRITNDTFRKALYNYLIHPATQEKIARLGLYKRIKALPIFPIRTNDGVVYEAYSDNIYTHRDKQSDNNVKILEESIMTADTLEKMLGGYVRINELTEDVYNAKYQNSLQEYIRSANKSNKEKAFYVLNEYKNNKQRFRSCKDALKGMVSEIPMEMMNGQYRTGCKFVNKQGLRFSGSTIKALIVTDTFRPLAEFLGCTDVLNIHYDNIDMEIKKLSDEDIDDLQREFQSANELLSGFIKDEIIDDDQIEKFHLEYLVEDEEYDEDFPGKRVANLLHLRKHIRHQFERHPNPYVERKKSVREPKKSVDKEQYLNNMYTSEHNRKNCFCQMCRAIVPKRYIERNDVQKVPKYGWDQMYLSLCLKCSKDYMNIRNNEDKWADFIKNISEADVKDKEIVEVKIGNKTLWFTATHLAEIQTIFDLEKKEDEKAHNRTP